MLRVSGVLAMVVFGAACPSPSPQSPPVPPPFPPAPAPDIEAAPAGPIRGPVGLEEPPPADAARRYVDNGCGARRYPRHIVWPSDKGGITIEERISPCPPDARCVWAGIVWHEGTVAQTGAQLALSYENTPKAQGEAPPTALVVEGGGDEIVLVETLVDGTRCAFKRFGT